MPSNATLSINLPVTSLPASLAFYANLGFEQNHECSDDKVAMTTLSPKPCETPLTVMFLTHEFVKSFLGEERRLGGRTHAEVIICVSMPSEEVVGEI